MRQSKLNFTRYGIPTLPLILPDCANPQIFNFDFSFLILLLIPNYSAGRDSIKIWNVNCELARKSLKYMNSSVQRTDTIEKFFRKLGIYKFELDFL